MRLTQLDGFRGIFIFLMMTTHFALQFPAELQYFKHHYFGFVENAQGFVFISGIVVGLVYGKRILRAGKKPMFSALFKRIKTIVTYQVALILAICAMAVTLWDGQGNIGMFGVFADHPFAFPVASALLLTAPQFADVLPLYILLMLATPYILVALNNGRERLVLLISALVWVLSQTMISGHIFTLLQDWLTGNGLELRVGSGFRAMAWQLIFVVGLCIGFRMAKGTFSLKYFESRECANLVPAVAVAAVTLAALDIAGNIGYADFLLTSLSGSEMRTEFPIIYVASFAIDVFLVTWLFVAGKDSRFSIVRAIYQFLNWLVQLKLFVTIGRHSLWVYTYHVLFLYVWALVADFGDPGFLARNAIFLLVGLSLYPVAILEDLLKKVGAPQPRTDRS